MANLLQKAWQWSSTPNLKPIAKGASRGTMSSYVQGINPTYGQPLVATADAQGLITPERMREIVMRTPTASASMNAVLDYAGGVNLAFRNIDAAKAVPKGRLKVVTRIFNKPNPTQTFRHFMLSLMKDLFTFGFAAVEIERDEATLTTPVALWVLDAARLRIDFDEHGTVHGYDMVDSRGNPIRRGARNANDVYEPPNTVANMGVAANMPNGAGSHAWEPEEVIFFSLNPTSNSVYPYSRITQLFTNAVIEDMMMHFIATRFTDSNVPFGVMDLGDVTETELKVAIANWNTQAQEQHRILLTGSKGGSKWVPFGYHLKDLEATGLLAEVRGKIMAVLGMTMNELGESQDINKSNGYNLSFTFKKRAIEPMLNEIVGTFTRRLLWDELGFEDMEQYYDEIDSRDELLQAQIDEVYLKSGIDTINKIRNRRGDPDTPGGEIPYVFTGGAWMPVALLEQAAKNLMAVELAGGGTTAGPDNVRVKVGGAAQPQGQGGESKPEGAVQTQRAQSGQNESTSK